MKTELSFRKPKPIELPGMRFASEFDFRTDEASLNLDLEYYEWMLGEFKWEQQVTSETTDREWLKTKISLGYILIHNTPILWNQNKSKLQQFQQQLKTA